MDEYPIPKHHIYQVWNSAGQYLGVLQNVTSEYIPVQDINSLGPPSITIKVAQSGDTAALPVRALMSEDGKLITTEDGKVITTEGEPTNFGITNSKIKNGNIIKITEYSSYHPNGLLVFTGKVKKWKVKIGSKDDMSLMVYPLSLDLNNHILKSGEVLHSSATADNTSFAVYGGTSGGGKRRFAYQLPYMSRGMYNISSIVLKLQARNGALPSLVNVRVYNLYANSPPLGGEAANYNLLDNINAALGSASITVSSTTTAEYKFTFAIPLAVNSQSALTLAVDASGDGVNVFYTTTNSYNEAVILFDDGPGFASASFSIGEGFYKINHIPPFTKAVISNFDPGAVVRTFMSNYAGEGGIITHDNTTVELTGITVNEYTFSVNTVHEGLKAMLEYSPKGFYYFIDPGTNVLTFKRMSETADHVLIVTRHIQEMEIAASIEELKNAAYMTGGAVAGVNVFRYDDDLSSISEFGIELDRLNDIKVTTNSTADARINSFIDKNNDEYFESYVMVIDSEYDTTLCKPGHTLVIRGSGNDMIDKLILPIVRIERPFGYAKLYLGTLPSRETDIINDSQEQLLAIQTVANPNLPS